MLEEEQTPYKAPEELAALSKNSETFAIQSRFVAHHSTPIFLYHKAGFCLGIYFSMQ